MKLLTVLLFCPSILLADDIFLKTKFVLRNVQISDSTSEVLYVKTKERERGIPRANILFYTFSPFDLSKSSYYDEYDTRLLRETIQKDSINSQRIRDSIDAASLKFRQAQEKGREKLVIVKTLTGESITGEFISSTDTTVTYKTSFGMVTIEKKLILSADKPRDSMSKLEKESTNDGLTTEQRRVFTGRRLTIELEGAGVSTSDSYFRTSLYSSWRKWNAFEGFTPLSEEQFFTKTGYPKEALQANEYRSSLSQMTSFGVILDIGGAVLLYLGYSHTTEETLPYTHATIQVADPNTTEIGFGYVASIVGSTLLISSAIGGSKNSAPYSTVEGITEEYNRKLIERIKNGEIPK